MAGAKEAAEKLVKRGNLATAGAAGAKAQPNLLALSARLKSCPCYKARFIGLFQQAVKPGLILLALLARLKPCPCYKACFNGLFQQAVKPCPYYKTFRGDKVFGCKLAFGAWNGSVLAQMQQVSARFAGMAS